MKLLLLTPAPPGSLAGNRATAERWAGLLESLGHQVVLGTDYNSAKADDADLLIALHAWRSHKAVASWRREQKHKPLIVALTGTDLYRYQYSHPDQTIASMDQASALIVLHHLAWQVVPAPLRDRVAVVLQSAPAPARNRVPEARAGDSFDICVIGHLREEKDPLRAARAARLLPEESAVRVIQAGKAQDDRWERAARDEMATNPRYRWLGEIPREQTARLMTQSRAMVISSIMEGGANVVSEACRAGLPVLASDIAGNLGLLGEDYPGVYPVGDEAALAALMERAEKDPQWLDCLRAIVDTLAVNFTPEKERASLAEALDKAVNRS
ncbi:selenoneine biosynthesis selenosugar synthase SenB [Marinobacter lacisalsi]|uniref:Selenoneine biosynthesis selenosugar synthase SenB n=1 Tax=Marinobacter lacisalsi TaxID=475979 RepID=A0ABV8QFG2_9GAMM